MVPRIRGGGAEEPDRPDGWKKRKILNNEQTNRFKRKTCVVGMWNSLCDPVLLWVITIVYLLEIVPLYLALSEFLQQNQLGLLQPQLLLQLLDDSPPLLRAALLHATDHNIPVTPPTLQKTKIPLQLLKCKMSSGPCFHQQSCMIWDIFSSSGHL